MPLNHAAHCQTPPNLPSCAPIAIVALAFVIVVLFTACAQPVVGANASAMDADEMLDEALKTVDRELMAEAVAAGANINRVSPNGGQTLLMRAVLHGEKDKVEALLAIGADVNIPERNGYTPIHGAGFQGRDDIVPILIAAGMDPLNVHEDGFIAMRRAWWGDQQRHTDTVRVFLEAGVPYDYRVRFGTQHSDGFVRENSTGALLRSRGLFNNVRSAQFLSLARASGFEVQRRCSTSRR